MCVCVLGKLQNTFDRIEIGSFWSALQQKVSQM